MRPNYSGPTTPLITIVLGSTLFDMDEIIDASKLPDHFEGPHHGIQWIWTFLHALGSDQFWGEHVSGMQRCPP